MTIDNDPRQQQDQQSLSQALLLLLRGGLDPPGSSLQPLARMSHDEQRAYLISTLDVVIATISDVNAPVIVCPPSFNSSTSSESDEEIGQAPQ
jgi:hypothetical protein